MTDSAYGDMVIELTKRAALCAEPMKIFELTASNIAKEIGTKNIRENKNKLK